VLAHRGPADADGEVPEFDGVVHGPRGEKIAAVMEIDAPDGAGVLVENQRAVASAPQK
jgi:hypothetical protein